MGVPTPRDEARVIPLTVDSFYPTVLWVEAFCFLCSEGKPEPVHEHFEGDEEHDHI
jgi:hypothetical protein